MPSKSVESFYKDISKVIPKELSKEIGHFNVFNIEELYKILKEKPAMPYDRRSYYKISLIEGRNKAEYADKVIEIEKNALLFATPKVPYHYVPLDKKQRGYFCIFTAEFLIHSKSGVRLDSLPIFKSGGYPVFKITDENRLELETIFKKMHREISSDYVYKYDLLRNYVVELIHYGQKLQPATVLHSTHNASERISSLFVELLERQFPLDSPRQQLQLITPKDYADRLAVHVNHLNKVLKENTGKTTTEIIAGRIIQEAKILLKQTNWTISEIAYSLGFEEVAHFSNFFKKQTAHAPILFREK